MRDSEKGCYSERIIYLLIINLVLITLSLNVKNFQICELQLKTDTL